MEYNRSRRSSTQNAYFGMSEEQRNRDMDILRFKLGHMKASIDNTPPRTYVAPPPAVRDRMDPREQRRRSLSPAGGERRSNQDSGVPYFSNTGGDVTRRAPSNPPACACTNVVIRRVVRPAMPTHSHPHSVRVGHHTAGAGVQVLVMGPRSQQESVAAMAVAARWC